MQLQMFRGVLWGAALRRSRIALPGVLFGTFLPSLLPSPGLKVRVGHHVQYVTVTGMVDLQPPGPQTKLGNVLEGR
jgi:hypothetical protein